MASTEQARRREQRARPRGTDEWSALRDELMRRPTPAEAHRYGRSTHGDLVFVLPGADDDALLDVARALVDAGKCEAAHVLTGIGVYLEN